MYILGIQNDIDAGAALFKDGKIVAAANEERFNRIKLYQGLPEHSIAYVLGAENISIRDVDSIAYGWMNGLDISHVLPKLVTRCVAAAQENPSCIKLLQERIYWEQKTDSETREKIIAYLKKQGVYDRVKFVDHHHSHAYSAFYTSPFESALVVTLDGRGDFRSGTISTAGPDGWKELDFVTTFDSLGYFYALITSALGFKYNRHEGKIVGLAAYGRPARALPLMRKMIEYKNDQPWAHLGDYYRPFFKPLPVKLPGAIRSYSREDVAAAAQKQLEDVTLAWISKYLKQTKLVNICLAGGVFANVKLNQRILELPGVENIYIHPNMGDGGITVGSALYLAQAAGAMIQRPLEHVYLGPSFSSENAVAALEKYPVQYEKLSTSKSSIVSELLQKNKVVGWFQGRMEYGPRALGSRSILYHARDPKVNAWLNERTKRSEFMPFAPVTLEENAVTCYENWNPEQLAAWFMTLTYNCTPEMKKNSPAVVHVDGTARPQVIRKKHNPDYYEVVRRFHADTGALSLINTSFNHHEEPIVCSPEDAIKSLLRNNVDAIILNDFIVQPKGK